MFVMTKACVSDSGDRSSAAETKGWFDALVVEAFWRRAMAAIAAATNTLTPSLALRNSKISIPGR